MTQTVAVEIPAIPEDYETVRKLLPDMQKIGVRHLNLHQLYASEHNYRELARRGYTIAPSVEHGPVVFESEMTALKLVRQVAEGSMDFSANYCSRIYKARYQPRGRRRRAALLAPSRRTRTYSSCRSRGGSACRWRYATPPT